MFNYNKEALVKVAQWQTNPAHGPSSSASFLSAAMENGKRNLRKMPGMLSRAYNKYVPRNIRWTVANIDNAASNIAHSGISGIPSSVGYILGGVGGALTGAVKGWNGNSTTEKVINSARTAWDEGRDGANSLELLADHYISSPLQKVIDFTQPWLKHNARRSDSHLDSAKQEYLGARKATVGEDRKDIDAEWNAARLANYGSKLAILAPLYGRISDGWGTAHGAMKIR